MFYMTDDADLILCESDAFIGVFLSDSTYLIKTKEGITIHNDRSRNDIASSDK